jgi:Endonuclease/Exonuclease/phosphatase family 2
MWHERLVQAVRLAMPVDDPYVVAHTDNLVGLFSCIFVRQRQRHLLRDSAITAVKRGMGGRYGNKVCGSANERCNVSPRATFGRAQLLRDS